MIVFHVTLTSRLQAILSEGLRPQVGPRSKQMGEMIPAVYCFADRLACIDGLSNWLGDCFDPDEELVVMEVDIGGLAFSNHAGWEVSLTCPIGPDRILATYSEIEFAKDKKPVNSIELIRCVSR